MGIIADAVRRYVPASYSALAGATNSYGYTLDDIQTLADFVQFRYFATVPGESSESSLWNPIQAEFLGIMTTLEFIPAAIDYWGDQIQSQATAPTDEDVTYFDRRPDLWKLYEKLVAKAESLAPEVGVATGKLRGFVPQVSYGDNGRGVLITPDPQRFPPAFRNRTGTYVDWESLEWNAGNLWDSEA